MTIPMNTMSEPERTLLYVLGLLQDFGQRGLVDGSLVRALTSRGIASFDQLVASGWHPADAEVEDCLSNFLLPEEVESTMLFVKHWQAGTLPDLPSDEEVTEQA